QRLHRVRAHCRGRGPFQSGEPGAAERNTGMNIIGISGIEGAMPVKREHWPGLDEREYRISQGHDSAAALIVDGTIVACVAEERINRLKHSALFPAGAIDYCLREAGRSMGDVDELVHGFDYAPYRTAYAMDPLSAVLY